MSDRNFSAIAKVLLALAVLLLAASDAAAYVGPGADVAFISYAMTLLFWVATVFSAVLLWPVYALLRKIRRMRGQAKPPADSPTMPASAATCAENNVRR